jgi:hypothetical protein
MKTEEKTKATGSPHPTAKTPAATPAKAASPGRRSLDRVVNFFTSLRLTIVCLGLGIILVFLGTLAQVDLGLYKAQNEFFRSFIVFWGPQNASWKIPILPGGYLVGGMLLLNLVSAHIKRFQFSRKKIGIWMIHVGLILMLLGQLLTDMLARESMLHLREGESKNYSEVQRETELAVIDTTDPQIDKVVAIPQYLLSTQKEIAHPELPFKIKTREFFANSDVQARETNSLVPPASSRGVGTIATLQEKPRETSMDARDLSSAVIEILTPEGSIGTWLVSEMVKPQQFSWNNHNYELTMRFKRLYKPYSMQLVKFQHDIYAGTGIPKNFASRVVLHRPDTSEQREVLIYMNNPLRYSGETYYQADWDKDDHGTVLQVVRNPGWLTPYLSCIMVGAGLVVQFMTHLLGFIRKLRVA